jgi:hypothetical protein
VNATPPTITINATINGTLYTKTISVANGNMYAATDTINSACPSGYIYCFGLHTADNGDSSMVLGPTTRQFRIERYKDPSTGVRSKAQLQIADNIGSNNTNPLDLLKLTGVSLVAACPTYSTTLPCPIANWPGTVKAFVQIDVAHTFDARPNDTANGSTSFYVFSINEGGFMGTNITTSGNVSQIYGKGTFDTNLGQKNMSNTKNPDADDIPATPDPAGIVKLGASDGTPVVNSFACVIGNAARSPLCQTTASPTGQVSFGQGQSSPYPGFACSNHRTDTVTVTDFKNGTYTYTNPKCTPKITLTHYFTTFGPDTLNFSTSVDLAGGICGANPLPSCDCSTSSSPGHSGKTLCDEIVANANKNKQSEDDAQQGVPESQPCTGANCNVNFVVTISATTPGLTNGPCVDILRDVVQCNVYPFLTAGPIVHPFTITVDPATGFGTGPELQGLISGDVGAEIIIWPDYDHWPVLGNLNNNPVFQEIDQVTLSSDLGTTIVGTDVVSINCPGGDKTPIVGYRFGIGDTVRALAHVKTARSQPHICPIPELTQQ